MSDSVVSVRIVFLDLNELLTTVASEKVFQKMVPYGI